MTPQVIDQDNVLSAAERARLEGALPGLARQADVELAVLLVRHVPGRQFRQHAVAARQAHATDRGVILVVAVDDRHAELATPPRFKSVFTSQFSAELLRRTLVPLMRQGRTADAVIAALSEVSQMLRAGPATAPVIRMSPRAPQRTGLPWVLAVVGAILALIAGLAGYSFYASHTCAQCGGWGRVQKVVLVAPTATSSGTQERRFACGKCGRADTVRITLPPVTPSSDSSWSSDSGSFDSGGGSDSGGSSDGGGGADW